jgi:shikimate kinase
MTAQRNENIFLVGLMGAGKTTVGKLLAKHLNKTFCDSDHEIERRTGVDIPVIFEIEGEAGFRQRERTVIAELTARSNIVLATGGGVVLNPENREELRNRGTVVYLRATAEDLWLRTRYDRNRPLLQTSNPKNKLVELFQQRDPLYQEVAHIIVDTSKQSVQSLVQQLERKLAEMGRQTASATVKT